MPNTVCDFLTQIQSEKFATNAGKNMHERLRIASTDDSCELAQHILATPGLAEYFTQSAKTEVPIAGTIRGKFISRRIDRLVIDHDTKTIKILDYKTDIDRKSRRTKYIFQLREYQELLHAIYPDFKIFAAILWTHDWTLESI